MGFHTQNYFNLEYLYSQLILHNHTTHKACKLKKKKNAIYKALILSFRIRNILRV